MQVRVRVRHVSPPMPHGQERSRRSLPLVAAVVVVASPLVALHVAAYAEGLAAAGMWALEGLLARVGVAVDTQRAGP